MRKKKKQVHASCKQHIESHHQDHTICNCCYGSLHSHQKLYTVCLMSGVLKWRDTRHGTRATRSQTW